MKGRRFRQTLGDLIAVSCSREDHQVHPRDAGRALFEGKTVVLPPIPMAFLLMLQHFCAVVLLEKGIQVIPV